MKERGPKRKRLAGAPGDSAEASILVGMTFVRLMGGLVAAALLAAGQSPTRPAVRAGRIDTPPELDGRVDDEVWKAIEPATGFTQRNPDEGARATEETEVRFAFDDQNLYIGIRCLDSEPQAAVLTQNRRDGEMENTDSIQILLDTFNDGQNAFVFGTTPTGIEYDAQISKAGQDRGGGSPRRAGGAGAAGGAQRGGAAATNINWDAAWQVRAQTTGEGWEAEMAIPFRTLRYRPGDDMTWGLNIFRLLRRRNEESFWAPITRAFELTQISLAGTLTGLSAEGDRNLKLLPYVVGGFSQDFRAADDRSKLERDAGLDLKYGLTPSLTLDATLNTDFAQVEVDDEQVNLTRFDLFFPEKRPFFLENAGFFEFGTPREVELFFSRRIGIDENRNPVPIDAGARVSGKAGPYQIGFLEMQTRSVDGRAPANNYAVARLNRELPNRSSIGVIALNRQSMSKFEGDNEYNRAYGVDANIGLGKYGNWFNYLARTKTPGKTSSQHAGASYFVFDDATNQVEATYREVGRNFNPEVGFVNRVGYRHDYYGYRRRFFPNSSLIRSIEPHFGMRTWRTIETTKKESDYQHFHFDTRWQNGGRMGVAFNRNFERLDKPFEVHPGVFIQPGSYRFDDLRADFNGDPTRTLFWTSEIATGEFYNGRLTSLNLGGGVRKGPNLTWTGTYSRNFVRLPNGDFTTDLVGLRWNWSFTPRSYLQTFSQYNSVARQLGHNIRLAFLSSSNTGLFVVFNTTHASYEFNDPHGMDRRTQSRALIIKFNHLLDF